MEFIRVTLWEGLSSGKKISNLEKVENYLLPIYGIKSISEKVSEPGTYYIYICESHIPTDFEFIVDHAIAKLPNGFVDIVN